MLNNTTGPPANVSLRTRSSRSLIIAWNPLKEKQYSFIAHTVQCSLAEQTVAVYKLANKNVTQVTIEQLLPFKKYTCCVSIQTAMANSTATCQQQRTQEDGNSIIVV